MHNKLVLYVFELGPKCQLIEPSQGDAIEAYIMVGTYRILSKFVHLVHQLHTTVVSRQVTGIILTTEGVLLIGGCQQPAGGSSGGAAAASASTLTMFISCLVEAVLRGLFSWSGRKLNNLSLSSFWNLPDQG